ncbi:TetR/AcrR family transcriptional regulator [Skermania piniformis]|uniref:TetR/AcrR family transcriptional regulator n=1 Tax=Skermania pinensis TaxID=39122 RepID=A0ABX8SBY4_9ACTN|nr:TetR/AcrR family transcriptional regulator [Skermania piniformis]QXQ15298.1 TetR/AcrR family transcriptional regulator [Skermania piniformis]
MSEPSRFDRRKARTRAALVAAAQGFLAEGNVAVPISEITAAADIGTGSFYNHFDTKEALFRAAAVDALDTHGALLDRLTADLDDPALAFAHSFRLTGRLHRIEPLLSKALLNTALTLIDSPVGLWPRARRDIELGVASGRFTVDDLDLTMTVVAGTMICLGQLLHVQPDRDDADATDRLAVDLLRHLGLSSPEARAICAVPLPDLA